jgi:hypothetical protein
MLVLALFLLLSFPLSAEEVLQEKPIQREIIEDWDILSFLGMEPEEAVETLGAPWQVYPYRGKEDWQDNVIFFYSNRLYLFWYNNRVWQVRLDKEYSGSVFDFSMGAEREKILELLGKPFAEDELSIIYFLPDQGYPVKMRLFFKDNCLSDFYLYRGDF